MIPTWDENTVATYTLIWTIVSFVIAGFGAWFGGRLGVRRALEQVRGERAFDKRLTWYESTVDLLEEFATAIEVALTFERAVPAESAKVTEEAWTEVQLTYLKFYEARAHGEIFGSTDARRRVAAIVRRVFVMAEQTDGFRSDLARQHLDDFDEYPDFLRAAVRPLAQEARHHLGLEPVPPRRRRTRPGRPPARRAAVPPRAGAAAKAPLKR